MKFILIEKDGDKFATIRVVDGDPEDISWDELTEKYTFLPGANTALVEQFKRVPLASVADRAARVAKRYDAVEMADADAVEKILPEEVVDQTDVYERGLDAPDVPPEAVDEGELDERLIAAGIPGSQLDDMTLDEKQALIGSMTLVQPEAPAAPVVKPKRVRAAPKKKEPKADPQVRGFRLLVHRHYWPTKVDGKPRWYEVGDTKDRLEADEIAARWEEMGFRAQVSELLVHPRASEVKHSIWTDEPYDPICCLMPGCDWVGDHLGPHLKRHSFDTVADYQEITGYKGPAVVGKAASALGQAHKTVKIRNDLRVGQIVLEIPGTSTVIPWRITAVRADGATIRRLSDEAEARVSFEQLFTKYHPIGMWARRLLQEKGLDVKPARRIQRRTPYKRTE